MIKYLIAVDLQRDFVDGALGTAKAAAVIPRAADKLRSFDGRLIVTFDTHTHDYLSTMEGRRLPIPHCIRGTDGWQLNSTIAAALAGRDFITVEKPTFGSIALPDVIRKDADGTDFSLELIGLCTDICVASNALLLRASFPEMLITVDAACCAGTTREAHRAALTVMRGCHIDILNA